MIPILLGSCLNRTTTTKIKIEEGEPKFVVQPEIHNFGTLDEGEMVYYSFKISNAGTGILNIDSIDSGCGCIEVNWSSKSLKQNDSDYLQVFYNSSGDWGNIFKPIIVYTNSKKNKHILYISANVNNQLFN